MLQIEHVSKKIGSFYLGDINFTIPKGYICGLIGANGAGKTSLLYLLLGLYRADKGQIRINGFDTVTHEIPAKDSIGYVLAEDLFDDSLSLVENGDLYGKYYSRYDRNQLIAYCKRFELDYSKKLKKHSKGEKLKFQFAFALAHDPQVLILDEPTANFDPEFRKEFFSILTDFIKDGEHSVLLATHLTSDLDRIADYITFIHRGKLVASTDREAFVNAYRLVTGEEYLIKLLPKESIIFKENNGSITKALIEYRSRYVYDKALSVTIPSIEDVMYYYIKGDERYV